MRKSTRCDADAGLLHVQAVATGQWPFYKQIWSMAEMLDAIAVGDQFYIQMRDTLETFRLCPTKCSACGMVATFETEDPSAGVKMRDLPVLH